MQSAIGWSILLFGGALYFVQLISSVNFQLAQRLGIQEKPEDTDKLLQRSERYTAYWDLFALAWLPLAGILIIADHAMWPIASIIGGAIYLDASGREAVKNLSLQHEGIKMGTETQRKLFFASYLVMALIGPGLIVYAVLSIAFR